MRNLISIKLGKLLLATCILSLFTVTVFSQDRIVRPKVIVASETIVESRNISWNFRLNSDDELFGHFRKGKNKTGRGNNVFRGTPSARAKKPFLSSTPPRKTITLTSHELPQYWKGPYKIGRIKAWQQKNPGIMLLFVGGVKQIDWFNCSVKGNSRSSG
jgi:hypothetical protein